MTEIVLPGAAYRRLRPALGTFVSAYCIANGAEIAERAIASAFDCFATVHRLMHPTSGVDLGVLRAARMGQGIRVHRWTWDVLDLSARINDASEGRFDPCLPDLDGCMADVELPEPEIVVLRKRIVLDLGGIAKGFAVDRAVESLMSAQCAAGEVNAGGDVRVFGPHDTPLWVRSYRGAHPIVLRDQAFAVSDPTARDRPSEHRGYYDRVAPKGEPVDLGTAPAVVVASTTAIADALTKCVLLCGHDPALLKRTLRHFDAATIEFYEANRAEG